MKYLLFLFFLGFSFLSFSQEKGLFFEISGNGLKKPSYIFGTMHLLCKGDFVLSDTLISKLKSTDQIALEVDLDDPKMAFEMLSKMKMKKDTSLSDLMSSEKYTFLKYYLKDTLGLPFMMFQKTKPFLLYSLIISKFLPCQAINLESELMKLGKGKRVLGLETLDFQMSLMDKMPYKKQADYLLETLADKSKTLREFSDLTASYLERDLSKMLEVAKEDKNVMGDFENEMLLKRNKAWIPEISKLINQNATFIAVGAAHLGGQSGVLQLLKNEGYTIKTLE